MNQDDKRVITEEGVHIVCDGNGQLLAILRRDPISKKHLTYMATEGSCVDIADLIKTKESNLKGIVELAKEE